MATPRSKTATDPTEGSRPPNASKVGRGRAVGRVRPGAALRMTGRHSTGEQRVPNVDRQGRRLTMLRRVPLCAIVLLSAIGPAATVAHAPPASAVHIDRELPLFDGLKRGAGMCGLRLPHDTLQFSPARRSNRNTALEEMGSAVEPHGESELSSGYTQTAAAAFASMGSSLSNAADAGRPGFSGEFGPGDAFLSGEDMDGSESAGSLTPLALQSPANSRSATHPLLQLPPLALPRAPAWELLGVGGIGQAEAPETGRRGKRGRRDKGPTELALGEIADGVLHFRKRNGDVLAIGDGALGDGAKSSVQFEHDSQEVAGIDKTTWHDTGMGMNVAARAAFDGAGGRGRLGGRSGGRGRGRSGGPSRGARPLRHCAHAEGCDKYASFGDPGNPLGELFCKQHKSQGHRNVVSKRCNSPGCEKRPIFGDPSTRELEFCRQHKLDFHVDLQNKRCQYPSCNKHPVFGDLSVQPAARVLGCAPAPQAGLWVSDGAMSDGGDSIDSSSSSPTNSIGSPFRSTASPGARQEPDGQWRGETRHFVSHMAREVKAGGAARAAARFCAEHKGLYHVDVRHRRCQGAVDGKGCSKLPSFGDAAQQVPRFCFAHKEEGHVYLAARRHLRKGTPNGRSAGVTERLSAKEGQEEREEGGATGKMESGGAAKETRVALVGLCGRMERARRAGAVVEAM